MRFHAALTGNLQEILKEELAIQRRAFTRTMREAGEEIKTGWRAQIRRAGLSSRLANAVRSENYPRGRQSRGAASLVYTRAGKDGQIGSAVAALKNMSEGAILKPTGGGSFLAIPTGYNLRQGQRQAGRLGRVIVTPEMMVKDKKMTFIIKVGGGALMWCIRVTTAEWRTKSGRIQRRAFRGNNHDQQLLGSGRSRRLHSDRTEIKNGERKWRGGIAKQGWIPMFLLVPEVKINRKVDLEGEVTRVANGLPARLLRNLAAEG